ncbi:SOS response-associated peptidase [Acidithiobacillus ferridurans]|uniref:SOS response-associated peptidase n=1 Tax=Acidithiobacillus ferridurans TaxID=1232575 RepID=UPI001C077BC0|nr:SOS response-associated peptidase [Acidithiobacillus ferridurans]MBU2805641.1 SOS response-associated peptidase [Acidithiobacillus ferridurans]
MCGRYSLFASVADLRRDFPELVVSHWGEPRYNIAPGTDVPILWQQGNHLSLDTCHWGFHPAWAREDAPRPINARAETVAEKPYFRESFQRHRCVFPANGFYEWQSLPGQKVKQPWYLSPAQGGLWYFAGIVTPDPCTSAILVTAANPQMLTIHERMPVILEAPDVVSWLDPETDPSALTPLLRPYPKTMSAWKVSPAVNRAQADDPALTWPFSA